MTDDGFKIEGAGEDPVRWTTYPVVEALHAQWWRARAGRIGESRLPFSRDWEELLSGAGLTTAELRKEAARDIGELAAAGVIRVKCPPRRTALIARVQVPVKAESRFAELFGDPVGSADLGFDPGAVAWEPELAFLREERSLVAADDLLALNRFFREGGRELPIVPVKERSIRIFGDEKRLDALRGTALLREGRLSLAALRAAVAPEPLGWRRGGGPVGKFIIVENLATWDSFARWNAESSAYAAVIYGAGFRVIDGVAFFAEIAAETGGAIVRLDYFGDLDPEGLRIPRLAGRRAVEQGWPVIEPLVWAYEWLFAKGTPTPLIAGVGGAEDVDWLGAPLAGRATELFAGGNRIAQEWLGWEELRSGGRPG